MKRILLIIPMLLGTLTTGCMMNNRAEPWVPETWSTVSEYAQYDSRFEADMDEQCWKFDGKPLAGLMVFDAKGIATFAPSNQKKDDAVYVKTIKENDGIKDFIVISEREAFELTGNIESMLNTYYAYNDTDAYRLVKSDALKRFLNGWTDASIVNPAWNYDSFTRYEGQEGQELYYCTFTADNGKYYYMVLEYDKSDGGGLGKVRYSETPYYYDLTANIDVISAKLSETQLNLSSTVASRVQLAETDKNRSGEVILFTDDSGNSYACYLDSFEIMKI